MIEKSNQRYTLQEVADALQEAGGNATQAALMLGCTRATVRHYLNRYPALVETRRQARIAHYATRYEAERE